MPHSRALRLGPLLFHLRRERHSRRKRDVWFAHGRHRFGEQCRKMLVEASVQGLGVCRSKEAGLTGCFR